MLGHFLGGKVEHSKAREYGLAALKTALDGVTGRTALHICFGYAAIIHERPAGYNFLPELAGCSCKAVSIETAQSNLDTSVLETLPDKKIILGVLDLSTNAALLAVTAAPPEGYRPVESETGTVTLQGNDVTVLIAAQPREAGRTALHLTVTGNTSAAIRRSLALWATDLRNRLEAQMVEAA